METPGVSVEKFTDGLNSTIVSIEISNVVDIDDSVSPVATL